MHCSSFTVMTVMMVAGRISDAFWMKFLIRDWKGEYIIEQQKIAMKLQKLEPENESMYAWWIITAYLTQATTEDPGNLIKQQAKFTKAKNPYDQLWWHCSLLWWFFISMCACKITRSQILAFWIQSQFLSLWDSSNLRKHSSRVCSTSRVSRIV